MIQPTRCWSTPRGRLLRLGKVRRPNPAKAVRTRDLTDRQPYDVNLLETTGRLVFTGPPMPPAPYERGLKDTVRANPGEVTRGIGR